MKNKFLIVFIISFIFTAECLHPEYIDVKVKNSAILPDDIESHRRNLIEGAIKICTNGQRFYATPYVKGGGQNSFIGFSIPSRLDSTDYGYYKLEIKPKILKVLGFGYLVGEDGTNPIMMNIVATPNHLATTVNN